jgi:hypothetical protein
MKYNNNEISVFAGINNTFSWNNRSIKTYYGHLTIILKKGLLQEQKNAKKANKKAVFWWFW